MEKIKRESSIFYFILLIKQKPQALGLPGGILRFGLGKGVHCAADAAKPIPVLRDHFGRKIENSTLFLGFYV